MLALTLFKRLMTSKHVLIAGTGGGFDVFSGLPLYFALKEAGTKVDFASLSFTILGATDAEQISPGLYMVTPESSGPEEYFPEKHLGTWLRGHGHHGTVWCMERRGVLPLKAAYRSLLARLGFDTVVLVDGGTDSLMRGDEAGLGTPVEDVASITAVSSLQVPQKMLICTAFGVDRFHGVCHAQFLEGVADLTQNGAFLGAFALTADMPGVRLFREATDYVQERTPGSESIVYASITSALDGHFGNYHRTARTTGSTLWINPLMTFYWAFDLDAVAKRILYMNLIRETSEFWELFNIIIKFHQDVEKKPFEDIPL